MCVPATRLHTDAINDIVMAGIQQRLDAGLCWACPAPGADHAPGCPEGVLPVVLDPEVRIG